MRVHRALSADACGGQLFKELSVVLSGGGVRRPQRDNGAGYRAAQLASDTHQRTVATTLRTQFLEGYDTLQARVISALAQPTKGMGDPRIVGLVDIVRCH